MNVERHLNLWTRLLFGLNWSSGAQILGGGTGSSGRGAEGAGGAAEETRAGAGRERDRHSGAGAEHHHPPDVPGETQCEEEEGPLQEEQTEAGPRQQLYQSALWCVNSGTAVST